MYSPGRPHLHQSTAAAKRREADRVRKAEARAAAKAAGVPEKSLVDHAIAEGVSFCITNADRSAWRTKKGEGWTPINAAAVYAIAIDVLVLRHHKDHAESKAALDRRLGPQEGHTVCGAIPSTNPAPGQPKYRLTAPADLSTPRSPAPPLHPQDTSKKPKWLQQLSDN